MSRSAFIIDDADFMVDMLRLVLSEGGYSVAGSATDALVGLEQLRRLTSASKTVDIVIVDLHMPKLDGFETIRGIREILPKAKVLLVSANATLPVALKAKAIGVDGFVVKPFEPETVLETLRKMY
ncbi:MAG: response regulator [Fretibacterium sp.]|uniref:response regulator n=1 Tax=Fretibacterium sp. OH1220_COT-178 TaxID=2491047 RepID=UPI000F5EF67B|nr:response regulator [Fretibacterium sp. OH1220_COT-178]MDO4786834.1 response regulator [Fretibacterium sp.]RRD63238.1 response regulator [Fretibacterium sp. OH1220_COT-178]